MIQSKCSRMFVCFVLVLMTAGMVLTGCGEPPADGLTAEEFYANNVLTVVSTGSPGGGCDFSARLFATYWSTITGGVAKVENISEGGGLVGTNHGYLAEPDGLTVTCVDDGGYVGGAIFGAEGVQWDLNEYIHIGCFGQSPSVLCVSVEAPYETVGDLVGASNVTFGAYSPPDEASLCAAFIAEVLEMDEARIVSGYGSSGEASLALARGEILVAVDSAHTTQARIENEYAKAEPLIVMGFNGSAWFPEAPYIAEVATLNSTQEQKLEVIVGIQSTKGFLVTPGTPQDRVDYLVAFFQDLVEHEGFLKQAQLRWPIWETPLVGTEYAEKVTEAAQVPPDIVDEFFEQVMDMIYL